MKITDSWIKKYNPCRKALDWWDKKERNSIKILEKLIAEKHYDWANWFIVRTMTYKQYVSYAIFAAEQVIDIYEKKYPNDDRPRKAIEAARICLKNRNKKNKDAASAAHATAYAAASAAHATAHAAAHAAASAAAYAAASAAHATASAAAYAAASAAHATAHAAAHATAHAAAHATASAAASAAHATAYAAAYAAASAAYAVMKLKILTYGMELLRGAK